SKFMLQLTSVAQELQLRLGARSDRDGEEAKRKVFNAIGIELSATGGDGSGGNAKALKLLQQGFKCKPPVYYYQGGDTPKLPPELEGRITAEILAPSPKDSAGGVGARAKQKKQNLAAPGRNGIPDAERKKSIAKAWRR